MHTHTDKIQENKSQSIANAFVQKQSGSKSIFQFVDNRPEVLQLNKIQQLVNNNKKVGQLTQLKSIANEYVKKDVDHPINKSIKEDKSSSPLKNNSVMQLFKIGILGRSLVLNYGHNRLSLTALKALGRHGKSEGSTHVFFNEQGPIGNRPANQSQKGVQDAAKSFTVDATKDRETETTRKWLKREDYSLKEHNLDMAHGVSINRIMTTLFSLALNIATANPDNKDDMKKKASEYLESMSETFDDQTLKEEIVNVFLEAVTNLESGEKSRNGSDDLEEAYKKLSRIAFVLNVIPGNLTGGDSSLNASIGKKDDPHSNEDGDIFPETLKLFEAQRNVEGVLRPIPSLVIDPNQFFAGIEDGHLISSVGGPSRIDQYVGPTTSPRAPE